MITIEQSKVLSAVLKRFNDSEVVQFTPIDDQMEFLAFLSDEELVTEVTMLHYRHVTGNARCDVDHSPDQCFVPVVISAISYILNDYKSTKRLAKKVRYILEYYMALSHTGSIISN